jgi:hypothetical protein
MALISLQPSKSASSGKPKTPSAPRSKSVSSSTTAGTKAPVLTREEKRKLREDREFGVAAPSTSTGGKKKISEGDRVARMLAAATAGRGLNAKIPERSTVKRSDESPRAGADTANRTGPTYKAHNSIAHQVTEKPMKPLERVQQRARELATSNLGKDRRSIDQVQREIKGARVVDDDRDFFDGPRRGTGNGKSEGKRKQVEPRITPEDSSYVINKMGLLADEREYKSRNGHSSKASSSVPSKRRRRSLTPSDASDASSQDFDSDDLDDVDVRRKKKKKQASTIGASTRRREEAALPRKRPPAGGSVLAAAGLDIYAMFGRKDRELWVPLVPWYLSCG